MFNKYTEKSWYALYTKPRHEFKAAELISSLGIEFYLPTITRLKQWSDRKKKVTEPLLHSYIFINAIEKERIECLDLPPVVNCIMEGNKAARIPEYQIDNLRHFIKDKNDYFVYNGIVNGTIVRIKEGPFKDIEGVVIDSHQHKAIGVSIPLLNRTVFTYFSDTSVFEVISTPQNINNNIKYA